MEGNSQGNVSSNHTESSNREGSGRQVTNYIIGNNIDIYIQTFNNPSTRRPSDVVIDYCPTPVSTFICREKELEELKKLFEDHQVIVLTGMGGLGKTQLSCKFASVNKDSYRYRYRLEWETTKNIDDSFNGFAKKLRVDLSNKNVLVNDVYKALEKIPTLLIFDNVEKPEDVYKYLPTRVEMTHAKVHVLITSRCKVWACDTVKCYPLKPLDEQAAQQLFEKNFGEAYMKVDESLWKELANNFGHLPLALQLAASYLIERHEVNSDLRAIVTKYIEQLVEYNSKSIYNSMILTLELIEKMQNDAAKQAVKLMNVACYMNPHGISKKILLQFIDGDDKEDMLDNALVILTKFSLMNKLYPEYNGYTMHRIIQSSIRHSQTEKGTTDYYYTVILDLAVDKNIIGLNYMMRYADEQALCVYRYYKDHQSSSLLSLLVHHGSCVALRLIFESMDKADIKLMINENELLLESKNSNIDMMELLHEYGADFKQKDYFSRTILHFACRMKRTDIVQWLLEHDADLFATDKNGRTAAHYAVDDKHTDMFSLLLKWDKNIIYQRYGNDISLFQSMLCKEDFTDERSVIHFANIFIKYGVDVKQTNTKGQTIIHVAAKHVYIKLALHILQLHPRLINIVDNEGRTPLHVIGDTWQDLDEDDVESTIKVLMEYGLFLDTRDNQGRTILHTVSRRSYPEAISFILQENPSLINIADNEGRTPVHVVGVSSSYRQVYYITSSIEIFMEYCESLDTKDNQNSTILHTLSRHSYPKVISFVLESNPSLINAKDNEGRTALHVVGDIPYNLDEDNIISSILILMQYGLSLNTTDNQGRTVLHTLSRHSYSEVISFILQLNPSVINSVDNEGRTALHVVGGASPGLDCNRINIFRTIEVLEEYGLSMNTVDNQGRTPYDIIYR